MSVEDEVNFQFLAEYCTDLICRAGPDLVLRYASPSSIQILGWTQEEMKGKRLHAFVLAEDLPILDGVVGLPGGVKNQAATLRMEKKDGTTVWIEINYHLIHDTEGQAKESVILMRDISARVALEEQLSALAVIDSLTGLSTQRAFDESFEREWKRSAREGSPISLLLLDFHNFRQFHDQQGHQEGDSCLRTVSAAVAGALRATDVAARYDKEGIAIILPSTDSAGAAKVAEKVRAAIETLRSSPGGDPEGRGRSIVNIGMATVLARAGGTARMPGILLLAADHALDTAKHQLRSRMATVQLSAPKDH